MMRSQFYTELLNDQEKNMTHFGDSGPCFNPEYVCHTPYMVWQGRTVCNFGHGTQWLVYFTMRSTNSIMYCSHLTKRVDMDNTVYWERASPSPLPISPWKASCPSPNTIPSISGESSTLFCLDLFDSPRIAQDPHFSGQYPFFRVFGAWAAQISSCLRENVVKACQRHRWINKGYFHFLY